MNRKHFVLAVLVTALFVFAIGAVWVVADDNGVIHACVNPAGQPRIVNSPDDCRIRETYLGWNIVGLQGEKGPAGADGSSCSVTQNNGSATITCTDGTSATVNDGAEGPAGPPGIIDVYYGPLGSFINKRLRENEDAHAQSDCDPGDIAISRYLDHSPVNYTNGVIADYMFEENGVSSWIFFLKNNTEHEVTVSAYLYAICLDITE